MPQKLSATNEQRPVPNRRRWSRWLVFGAFLLALTTHGWWLSGIGRFLVAEEPISRADVVLVIGGDHRLHRAAELIADETVSQIWLIEQDPRYAVSAGILPATHVVAVEQLTEMGVPESQIRVLAGAMREIDDAARIVEAELQRSPQTTVLVLCNRLHGRNVRLVFSKLLDDSQTAQIRVLGIRADEFDERNWWRSRTGWKETFTSVADLLFTMVVGIEPVRGPQEWSPDAYEQRLVSEFGEAACHVD